MRTALPLLTLLSSDVAAIQRGLECFARRRNIVRGPRKRSAFFNQPPMALPSLDRIMLDCE